MLVKCRDCGGPEGLIVFARQLPRPDYMDRILTAEELAAPPTIFACQKCKIEKDRWGYVVKSAGYVRVPDRPAR